MARYPAREAALRLKLLVLIGCLVSAPPTFAQDPLADAPRKLSLAATREPVSAQCRRVENAGPSNLAPVVLRRTFNDDFNVHPLAHGRWVPHYAGGAMWRSEEHTSELQSQSNLVCRL